MNGEQIREAVRQQLETDRLLGIRSVPVKIEQRASASPGQVERRVSGESQADKKRKLDLLDESDVRNCKKCALSDTRTKTVFGQGWADARLVFVGEAPGFEEDRQGLAFVGRAGQLLTKMIAAMGLSREEVYICNVLKCRPPGNRDPLADEILACNEHLSQQLQIIQPEVVVALGAPAAKTLLHTATSIGKLRGRFHDYHYSGTAGQGPSVPLMPTYHPAYLLRNASEKVKAWEDLKMVMELLGLSPPARQAR